MSWALAALGLDEDADERAIKRAYAARLKVTRPDEDPAGFQQLHETYQAALGWARQFAAAPRPAEPAFHGPDSQQDVPRDHLDVGFARASLAQETAPAPTQLDADVLQPANVSEAPERFAVPEAAEPPSIRHPALASRIEPAETEPPSVDVAQMQVRILHQAQQLEPAALRAWLLAQPELWSLDHKPQIGADLQRHLLEHEETLSLYHYEVLADFFDWEQALDAPDPYLVQHACARMHQRWRLQPSGYGELSEALRRRGDPDASVPYVRKLLALLGPSASDGAVFAAMLWPGRPTRMRRLLELIGYVPDGRKPPPPLHRERANTWYLAGERHMFNPIAFMIGVARSLIAAAAFLLLCLLLAMLDRNPAPGISPMLKAGGYGAALIVGGWLAWDCFASLLRWQSRHETDACVRHPLLQRFFIPMLGMVAIACIAADKSPAAAAIAFPLLVIAVVRWMRRAGYRLQLAWGWGWVWAGFFVLKAAFLGVGMLILYPQVTLGGTAIAWLGDLISQWKARKKALA
ncbi:hypothetical protein J7373_07505 [Xanthomonas sp. A2111]|uniref:J domain-containing protein n=1 Tax=Xanthomonas hawaiiensis TaxID=3003247 RepID=A0ABU2HZS3_9XANT|nr:J domain-containing protein [Xanthomonas sp. A2111]MBO9828095.1 hypothetical protein [Xanthomonas sp. A2111]MDS9991391.1 J domain-containing protein [Xanthomonas sp. A2111]